MSIFNKEKDNKLNEVSKQFSSMIAPPRSQASKRLHSLVDDYDKYFMAGDFDVAKKVLKIISEEADKVAASIQ